MKLSASAATAFATVALLAVACAQGDIAGRSTTVAPFSISTSHMAQCFRKSISSPHRSKRRHASLVGCTVSPGRVISKAEREQGRQQRMDSKADSLDDQNPLQEKNAREREYSFGALYEKISSAVGRKASQSASHLECPETYEYDPGPHHHSTGAICDQKHSSRLRSLIVLIIALLIVFGSLYTLLEYLLGVTRASACSVSTVYVPVTYTITAEPSNGMTSPLAASSDQTSSDLPTTTSTSTSTHTVTTYVTVLTATTTETGSTPSSNISYFYTVNSAGSTDWISGVSPSSGASLTTTTRTITMRPVGTTETSFVTLTPPAFTSTTYEMVGPDLTSTSTSTHYVTYSLSQVSQPSSGQGPRSSLSGVRSGGWNMSATTSVDPTTAADTATQDPPQTATLVATVYYGSGHATTSTTTTHITTTMHVAITTTLTPTDPDFSGYVTTITALPFTVTGGLDQTNSLSSISTTVTEPDTSLSAASSSLAAAVSANTSISVLPGSDSPLSLSSSSTSSTPVVPTSIGSKSLTSSPSGRSTALSSSSLSQISQMTTLSALAPSATTPAKNNSATGTASGSQPMSGYSQATVVSITTTNSLQNLSSITPQVTSAMSANSSVIASGTTIVNGSRTPESAISSIPAVPRSTSLAATSSESTTAISGEATSISSTLTPMSTLSLPGYPRPTLTPSSSSSSTGGEMSSSSNNSVSSAGVSTSVLSPVGSTLSTMVSFSSTSSSTSSTPSTSTSPMISTPTSSTSSTPAGSTSLSSTSAAATSAPPASSSSSSPSSLSATALSSPATSDSSSLTSSVLMSAATSTSPASSSPVSSSSSTLSSSSSSSTPLSASSSTSLSNPSQSSSMTSLQGTALTSSSSITPSVLTSSTSPTSSSSSPLSFSTLSTTTSTSSSTVSPPAASPTSGCGESGNFTISFDNLPNFIPSNEYQTDITQAPPIPNPTNHLTFSDGYVYAPPPGSPYPPVSLPHLAVFLANNTGMRTSSIGNAVQPGEIGDGPRDAMSAYWFDAYSGWFGCDDAGPIPCNLVIKGYTWSASAQTEILTYAQNATIAPCPDFKDCRLQQVFFPTSFLGLSGLQVQAFVGNEEKMFFVDDLALRWSDDSCAAGLQRQSSL